MAMFISTYSVTRKKVLVISGAIDSGKTTGIQLLSRTAVNIGYYVIHLNLKGTTDSSDIKWTMEQFSSDLLSGSYIKYG